MGNNDSMDRSFSSFKRCWSVITPSFSDIPLQVSMAGHTYLRSKSGTLLVFFKEISIDTSLDAILVTVVQCDLMLIWHY